MGDKVLGHGFDIWVRDLRREKSVSSNMFSDLEMSNRGFSNTCNSKRGTEHDIPFPVSENVGKMK